jgi:hypothetical protein
MAQLRWYQRLLYALLNVLYGGPSDGPFYDINSTRNLFLALHWSSPRWNTKQEYVEFMSEAGFAYMPALISLDKYRKRRDLHWTGARLALRLVCATALLWCLVRTAHHVRAYRTRAQADSLCKSLGVDPRCDLTARAIHRAFRRLMLELYGCCQSAQKSRSRCRHPDKRRADHGLDRVVLELTERRDRLLALLSELQPVARHCAAAELGDPVYATAMPLPTCAANATLPAVPLPTRTANAIPPAAVPLPTCAVNATPPAAVVTATTTASYATATTLFDAALLSVSGIIRRCYQYFMDLLVCVD